MCVTILLNYMYDARGALITQMSDARTPDATPWTRWEGHIGSIPAEISAANSRQNIRKLIKDGFVIRKPTKVS